MFASTQFLFAFGLSPGFASPVSRCNTTPLTVTSVAAFTTDTPGVADVITTVHEPVPPDVVQLVGPTNEPGPDTIVKLITVPSGAFTKAAPVGFTFTCPVSVWFVPTAFAAVCGVIWMFASGAIQIFWASALSPT